MEKNNKTSLYIGIIVVVVVILGLGAYFIYQRPRVKSITVENGQFIVEARSLSRVEIWGVPSASVPDAKDNMLITVIDGSTSKTEDQHLVAHIPLKQLALKDIFVIGYGKNGKQVGRLSFKYPTGTDLTDAIWGTQNPAPQAVTK
jgi:hypothetical protein